MERRLAAILAADVVGYSRLMGEDEGGTLAALKAHRKDIFDPQVARHNGRIVKLMGDGVLVEFASVVDAVECALSIQRAVAGQAGPIRLRIGINLGDVILDGDDIYGDGVNVAARLEALADPGGVCISDAVHQSLGNRVDAEFSDTGTHHLKNLDRPIRVWRCENRDTLQSTAAVESTANVDSRPSIAVLPFSNMSGDAEQEYFADGITEDIIMEIAKIPDMMVISRNSTFTYKGRAAKVQDVCHDLGVRYVLEGSVRKSGERMRINAQLIDGTTGAHLWAERYNRGLEDIFAVQDDVTDNIVRALEVELIGPAKPHKQTADPEAYDRVLRGREQYRLFTHESNAAARKLYEQAIALDPDYAEPYAGLAETYVQDWFAGDPAALDRAFELAQQGAARNPALPLVQEALSTVHLFNRQHAEAIATARRWLELEPNSADAYATLAGAKHFAGENEEVIALVEKAMRLNPFYPFYYPHYIGLANLAMGRYDEAAAAFRRSTALNPEVIWPHAFLAACYGHLGDIAQARGELAEVHSINPAFTIAWLLTSLPYKRTTDSDVVVAGLRKAGCPA